MPTMKQLVTISVIAVAAVAITKRLQGSYPIV